MSTPQPKNLENVFIDDCLKELSKQIMSDKPYFQQLYEYLEELSTEDNPLDLPWKTYTIQTLLSRTPDGQAVIPFLDVETKDWKDSKDIYLPDNKVIPAIWTGGFSMENIAIVSKDEPEYTMKQIYKTLDHLLYREFTEALRVGKNFDLALQHINQLYIDHVYV